MPKQVSVSAGLLLYRRCNGKLEIFLAHPGGPFWEKRDEGAWTIPKGEVNPGEGLLDAARREFEEETSIYPGKELTPLGYVRQRSGKIVHAWAWEGDADASQIKSNLMRLEWPKRSGRWLTFPEIDRCAWFDTETAKQRVNPAQAEFITRLEALLQA